jgi:hypothetical protein
LLEKMLADVIPSRHAFMLCGFYFDDGKFIVIGLALEIIVLRMIHQRCKDIVGRWWWDVEVVSVPEGRTYGRNKSE